MGKLNAAIIRKIKPTEKNQRFTDGAGLAMVVRPDGSKAWRVRLPGESGDRGLGRFPDVTCSEARRKAKQMRAQHEKTRVKEKVSLVPSFAQVAELYITANAPTWKHHKTAADTRSRLETYAYPAFGARSIDTIRRSDVMVMLEEIWTAKPAAAKKLKQRVRAVFTYGLARDWIVVNPVDDAIDAALPKTPATKAHFRALPYQDVEGALKVVDASTAGQAVKMCFRWLVLTATRSGEARGARWEDIDQEAGTLTIPAERMKAGKEHRVPLSRQALEVLGKARAIEDDSGLVFPSAKGKKLSDMTLTKLLRTNDLAAKATVHGFRTSFKTWCMETTNTPWAVGEAALAHTIGNSTEQAYARSDLFDQRRELMQTWADFIAERWTVV